MKPGKTTKLRYSEVALRYSKIKGRLFDNLPQARESDKDFEPLYSSFATNGQFQPPLSSKEVLQLKMLQKQRGLMAGLNVGQAQRLDPRQSILKQNEGSQIKSEPEVKAAQGAPAQNVQGGAVNF